MVSANKNKIDDLSLSVKLLIINIMNVLTDGKDFDALVCYHEKDLALAVGKLVPILEAKHGYKCTSLQLSHLRRNCKY